MESLSPNLLSGIFTLFAVLMGVIITLVMRQFSALDGIKVDLAALKADVREISTDLKGVKDRLQKVEGGVDSLKEKVLRMEFSVKQRKNVCEGADGDGCPGKKDGETVTNRAYGTCGGYPQ